MSLRQRLAVIFLLLGLALLALTTFPLPAESSAWSANGYGFTLQWPSTLRAGEPHFARLKIQPPADEPPGSLFSARLEFAGLVIDPNGEITQPSGGNSTQPLEFQWSLTALHPEQVSGTLWIYRATQTSAGGQPREALVARPLVLRAVGIKGISILVIRWAGITLLALSAAWLTIGKLLGDK